MKWLLSILSLAMLGCTPASRSSTPKARADQKDSGRLAASGDPSSPWLVFGRGSCLGRCPGYRIEVDRSGNVKYHGGVSVKVEGTSTKQLSVDKIQQLKVLLRRPILKTLKADCCNCSDRTDDSSAGIRIFEGKSVLNIDHYHGCSKAPKELNEIEDAIDIIVGTSEWTGTAAEREALR